MTPFLQDFGPLYSEMIGVMTINSASQPCHVQKRTLTSKVNPLQL